MCGVVGILGRVGSVPNPEVLGEMAGELGHRGPDSSDLWIDGHIGLGHTRLSLLDLRSEANQPWTDGSHALVFNGEIYNFVELTKELEAAGESFRTTCDTEVLFVALRRWGVSATLPRLRGMFAFAYFDKATGVTHLCRDRYGIKPLVYMERGDSVDFASETKALKRSGAVRVDPIQALFAIRTLGDKYASRTSFQGVRQVPPGGHVQVVDGTVVSAEVALAITDFIDPDRYRELSAAPFSAALDEFSTLLSASVKSMAVADAYLGAFLSGGVDSGVICALAAGERDDFRGFTSDVAGSSELGGAQQTASAVGFDLSSIRFESDDWLKCWSEGTWALETPVITNVNALPFGTVARLAHQEGYKAVLTGEGSDELFLGYPRLTSVGLEQALGAPLTALQRLYRKSDRIADVILDQRDQISAAFVRGVAGGFEEDAVMADAVSRYSFAGTKESRMMAESIRMMSSGLQALLLRNDRMGMMSSIESRFPFLDDEVVAFAVNLPVKHKVRRVRQLHDPKHPFLQDKAVVRELGARLVGRELADRRKLGFPVAGLRGIKVKPGAFAGSWIADTFGVADGSLSMIDGWHQPYDRAKLASVEVFGRLFDAGQSRDEVDEWITANVELG